MKYLCWVSFVNRLKQRWNVEKAWMVWVILLVFALTGFTVMYLKKFFKPYMGDDWWVDVVAHLRILLRSIPLFLELRKTIFQTHC
jgi:hypothetical protein